MRASLQQGILTIYCFFQHMKLLIIEVPIVWFFMWRLRANALPSRHGWLTGSLSASEQGVHIWPLNIVYCSPTRRVDTQGVDDAEIASKTGEFLRRMVQKSCAASEIPAGPKRRMPHAVNYIHGAVHYNGLTLIFDDFSDLLVHLSDQSFRAELRRVVKLERRELTFLFRQRQSAPLHFAYCVGAVRNYLPWFSNANGPSKKPVLWGNMAPYPAINLINGSWLHDIENLRRGKYSDLMRPSLVRGQYFQQFYAGEQTAFRRIDQLQAWWIAWDVRFRGFRGQLFFTNRKLIEAHRQTEYREAGGYLKWSACHKVPFPVAEITAAELSPIAPETKISVIIPTLNEAAQLGACLTSVRKALPNAEIVVADGGSTDATLAIAQAHGVRITQGSSGRGAQLLLGITESSGPLLVLLHADSTIVGPALAALQLFCADPARQVAKLSVRFDSAQKRYRMLEFCSRFDHMLTSYGDQGIVVRRDFLLKHRLLQALPLFEDAAFFQRARRLTRVTQLAIPLLTSTRRFQRLGFVTTHLRNTALILQYCCGVSPAALHAKYYRRS